MDKLSHRMLDDLRLIGDLLKIKSLRYSCHKFGGGAADSRTKLQDIGAFCHHHTNSNGGLALLPDLKIRRIDKTMGNGRDVAQTEHAAISFNWRLGDGLGPIKSAGDAQWHALRCGFDDACWHHRILPGKGLKDLVGRYAKCREFSIGELDEDLFILRSVQVNFGDVLNFQ